MQTATNSSAQNHKKRIETKARKLINFLKTIHQVKLLIIWKQLTNFQMMSAYRFGWIMIELYISKKSLKSKNAAKKERVGFEIYTKKKA